MELELFGFIEQIMSEYQLRLPSYSYAEGIIRQHFSDVFEQESTSIVGIHTRIKSEDSLKEKLLRNRFYRNYETAEDALDHLSDVIGITIECRFIRNEAELYHKLFTHFEAYAQDYARSLENSNLFLNLNMYQPQLQRNGFTIYRIDGYYLFNGSKINFELQIKSLVHRFWSEIEHEVIYKNPEFVFNDHFMKSMLGAVRDNLDVVDHQLEIIYNEISSGARRQQIGIDESGFKVMTAASINELVNTNMKQSMGFSTDFKKNSSILSQYIYLRNFVSGEANEVKMVDYLEHLNFLAAHQIDFRENLQLESAFESDDRFLSTLGNYWISVLNRDFEWHVFFVMLFAIQPGNNIEDFNEFLRIIKMLLIQKGWYVSKFTSMKEHQEEVLGDFEEQLAKSLVAIDQVEIVHEDRLLDVMNTFRTFIEETDAQIQDYETFCKIRTKILDSLDHRVRKLFIH